MGKNALIWGISLAIAGFLLAFWSRYLIGFGAEGFIDVKSYWLGAELAFGQGLSPYTPEFEAAALASPGGYAHPYVYPPPSLLIFAPFAALDPGSAGQVMLWVNHIALLFLTFGIARLHLGPALWQKPGTLALTGVIVFVVLAAQPTRITLGHGQVNILVTLGILALLFACQTGRYGALGAIGLIVAVLLKPYFAIFALFVFARAGRHLLIPAIVITLATLAVSGLVLPVAVWRDWFGYVLGSGADPDIYLGKFNIFALENYALGPALRSAFGLEGAPDMQSLWRPVITAIMVVVLLAQLIVFHIGTRRTALSPAFVSWLCALFLIVPVAWVHYLIYPLVGGVILSLHLWQTGRLGLGVLATVLTLGLLQALPFGWMHYQTGFVALLWALAVGVGWQDRRAVQ